MFEGEAIGAVAPGGVATGELVFNTVLSGYQEVITDPSYAGQVVAFTYPHIGNYGVTARRRRGRPPVVSRRRGARPAAPAVVLARRRARSRTSSSAHGVPGITGVDTRRLTRHLRDDGAMGCAFGTAPESRPGRRGRGRTGDDRARPGVAR